MKIVYNKFPRRKVSVSVRVCVWVYVIEENDTIYRDTSERAFPFSTTHFSDTFLAQCTFFHWNVNQNPSSLLYYALRSLQLSTYIYTDIHQRHFYKRQIAKKVALAQWVQLGCYYYLIYIESNKKDWMYSWLNWGKMGWITKHGEEFS